MPTSIPPQPLALWLDERCAFLRHLEAEAKEALQQNSNTERYRQLMQQKALFLSALSDEATGLLQGLPAEHQQRVTQRLGAFQRNAENALGLNSVFYMSALLYPDDHKEGEPNDLELFAKEVANWG